MNRIKVGEENSSPIEIYYEDHGTGRPVVLIAGYPSSGTSWEKQTAALLETGHRVITYDRRGFGRSSRPSVGYDFDTLADDLHILLTSLSLTDVSLVGFSMGTGEITRYIRRHGTRHLRRVILIGTLGPFLLKTPNNPQGVEPSVFAGLKAAIKADRASALRNLIEAANNYDVLGGTLVSQRLIEETWNIGVNASPLGALKSIDAWIEDFREDIPYNDLPTLILHAGEQDRVLPPAATSRRQVKLLKNGRLIEIEDAPHNILWSHAERVNEEIGKFLR